MFDLDTDDTNVDLSALFDNDDDSSWQTRSYYEGGSSGHMPYSLEPRPPSNFVGLMNQGATCYLNSLIQALFMTPQFREGIYSLVPDEIESADEVKMKEVDLVAREKLMSMGFDEEAINNALLLFPKPEQDLERIDWIFSGAQMDSAQKKKKIVKVKRKLQKIPVQLQKLFALLQKANQCAISTEDLTKSFNWDGSETREQHDAHELNRVLFDAIEKALLHTSGKNLLQSLYNGLQVNKIICLTCNNISERTETFQDIPVPVYHYNSLEESLHSIIIPEVLKGSNQYHCESCKKKVDAHRIVSYRNIPTVLNICLGRFEFNVQTGNRVKNSRRFKFPMVLDMKPYTEQMAMAFSKENLSEYNQFSSEEIEQIISIQEESQKSGTDPKTKDTKPEPENDP